MCKFCSRNCSRSDNLKRHLKTCKEKKKDDTVKESMTELARLLNEKDKQIEKKDKQFAEEIKKRDKQIELLIEKAGLITNNTNNNFINI